MKIKPKTTLHTKKEKKKKRRPHYKITLGGFVKTWVSKICQLKNTPVVSDQASSISNMLCCPSMFFKLINIILLKMK